jgi:hydantoinase/carbamoylase family amidase
LSDVSAWTLPDAVDTAAIPRADPRRIARFLDDVAAVGADPRGGWTRLAFSPEERKAHAVFADAAATLGLDVRVDAIGNSYADLPGHNDAAALVAGSHLDTVPRGGNFDGTAGVAAALEVARILAESGRVERAFRAVAFSAEEGARFGAPCIGSRIATGAFTADTLHTLVDAEGRSVADCARDVGLRPDDAAEAVWRDGAAAAYVELHIEQGAVLESRRRALGLVDTIGGSTRVELVLAGRADHSGTTPMSLRRDALTAASELVLEVERRATLHPTTVATVGRLQVDPGFLTAVPGLVELTLDVRDVDSDRQRDLAEDVLDAAARIAARRGLDVSAALISDLSPVVLHRTVRERLAEAAAALGVSFAVLRSGATHDAAHVARRIPAGMVLVPSRDGISHAPDEWSSVEDIARGVDVMAAALTRFLDRPANESVGTAVRAQAR